MEDYEEMASTRLDQPPAPRRSGRRWFLIGGLAFAFMLALGIGAVRGLSNGTTPAAALAQASTSSSQTLAVTQGGFNGSQTLPAAQGGSNDAQAALAATPGARGQCEALTVSSVSGNTIVAKTASGSSVTIHTTASTRYTQAGKTVAASAITVGTRINVMGTHNSDGSITATSIDIG
jgi:hypothetical protein